MRIRRVLLFLVGALGALTIVACSDRGTDSTAIDRSSSFDGVDDRYVADQASAASELMTSASFVGASRELTAEDCRGIAPGTFLGEDCDTAGLADFGLVCALSTSGSPRADACEARGLGVLTPRDLSPEVLAVFDQFRMAHDILREFELKVGAGLDPETAIALWPSVSAETLIAKERAIQQLLELEEQADVDACREISENITAHIADAVRWHRLYVKGESDRIKSFDEYGYVADPGLGELAQRFRNGVDELRQADQHLLDMARANRCPSATMTGIFSS